MNDTIKGADERKLFFAHMIPRLEFSEREFAMLIQYNPKTWEAFKAGRASLGAAQVPAGWRLVPAEITESMHVAAVKTIIRCTGNDDFPPRVYRAMLAAAPEAPAGAAQVPDITDVSLMELADRFRFRYAQRGQQHQDFNALGFGRAVIALVQQGAETTSAAQVPSPWQPIETAPKDGTRILAYTGYPAVTAVRWAEESIYYGRPGWEDGDSNVEWQPTHWMPMSTPPADLSQQGDATAAKDTAP